MTEPQRHDFTKIIAELGQAGVSVHKIATMMHRQFNQVSRWSKGSEPRHYEGEMLLTIHREYVPCATCQGTGVVAIKGSAPLTDVVRPCPDCST